MLFVVLFSIIVLVLLKIEVVVINVDLIVVGFYEGCVFLIKVLSLLIWGYDMDVLEMMLNCICWLLRGNLVGFMLFVYVVKMFIFGFRRFGFRILGVLEFGFWDEKDVIIGVVCVLNCVFWKVINVVGVLDVLMWVLIRLFFLVFIVVVGSIWLFVISFLLFVVVLVRIIFIFLVVWIIFFFVIWGLLLWL